MWWQVLNGTVVHKAELALRAHQIKKIQKQYKYKWKNWESFQKIIIIGKCFHHKTSIAMKRFIRSDWKLESAYFFKQRSVRSSWNYCSLDEQYITLLPTLCSMRVKWKKLETGSRFLVERLIYNLISLSVVENFENSFLENLNICRPRMHSYYITG